MFNLTSIIIADDKNSLNLEFYLFKISFDLI
jgi:hypothetical protein